MRVACRQGRRVGAGSRRRSVGRSSTAALGGRRRSRGARRAGLGTPAGIAAPTRACVVGARPPPRGQRQPPNHARSRRRWRGREPGRVLARGQRPNARLGLQTLPAVLLKRVVGRSLSPSVVRPCAWRAARAAVWGPDRAAVAWGALHRCVGRAPSVAWGAAGRTRYACRYRRAHARMGGGRPPAAPLPSPPPNRARSRHRWRGPKPGRFLRRRSRAVARLGLSLLPAALLKRRWAVPQPQRGPAMRVACRQGCRVGAGSRRRSVGRVSTAALGGRRRSRGARRAGLGTPAGIAAPTPACVVGARPPPRGQPSRPTTLAADAAGAALNLGVFYARRRVPIARLAPSNLASGAAEAGRWAALNP